MDSALTTVLLPLALALVMFGLGLSLTVGDFARVGRQPKAVVIALVLQLLVLPAICFGLVLAFDLPPLLAVGLPALLFCLASLTLGFLVPRLFGVVRGQAIASAFEIGVHNGTLAIAIAISVLDSVELAVPAAVYSVIMFPAAAVFGWAITRSSARSGTEAPAGSRD